jgi:hypothetical protein
MKYRILIDYGSEGWQFWDEDKKEGYSSLDKAVKVAQQSCYGSPFVIVSIIDWQAKPKKI